MYYDDNELKRAENTLFRRVRLICVCLRKGTKCLKKSRKFVQKGRIFKILKKFSVKLFTIKSFCGIIIIGRKKDFLADRKGHKKSRQYQTKVMK